MVRGVHRGVQEFLKWLADNPTFPGVKLAGPASADDLQLLEQHIGVPLPADLRMVVQTFNGGTIPSGTLLSATPGPGATIEGAVRQFAERIGESFMDPELPLPFHRSNDGAILAFDRSAGPVSDTWPIVDYYEDTGDLRLVHRTFDGWCRSCVAEWSAPDFIADFSLDKYLRAGERHAAIEPDVSSAHATVAHALKRAGQPEKALEAYLRGARCIPALPWCDWEALKLAAILGRPVEALEAASRLSARAPEKRWVERSTQPVRVADVVARVAVLDADKVPWVRLFDLLEEQSGDGDKPRIATLRRGVVSGDGLPPPELGRPSLLPAQVDPTAWFEAVRAAYIAGDLRDEDLLLDPVLEPLRKKKPFADILRIRREF
jgi:hypothetical protein